MGSLLEAKEYLRNFYIKYEIYVNPLVKFLVALISLVTINSTLGYMDMLKNPTVVLIVSTMCSFMPKNFIVILSAIFVLGHSYALALECALVVLAVFLLLFLLYFRFVPKDTLVVLFTPVLFLLKIPFAMPVAMGLLGGPISVLSVSCGLIVYYMIRFMTENAGTFSAVDAQSGWQKIRFMLDGICQNKAMLVTMAVFALVLLLVYMIRRMSVDNSWTIAIISGLSAGAVLLLICEFIIELNFSVMAIAVGSIISFIICEGIRFLEFNVDYNRTERVQFEDDEYYYYVKAVPKNVVATPEKTVKRINRQRKKSAAKPVKSVSTIKTVNGVSHTTVKTSNGVSRPIRTDESGVNKTIVKTSAGVTRPTIKSDAGASGSTVKSNTGESGAIVKSNIGTSRPVVKTSTGVSRPVENGNGRTTQPVVKSNTGVARPIAKSNTGAARPIVKTSNGVSRPSIKNESEVTPSTVKNMTDPKK